MAADEWDSLAQAIVHRLQTESHWTGGVHPDRAPGDVDYPYVTYGMVSGGETNQVHDRDPEFLIDVVCVSDNLGEALTGAALIATLLNDQGAQDGGAVTGDDDWDILTITQQGRIHLRDDLKEAQPIYHEGHEFEVKMEAT